MVKKLNLKTSIVLYVIFISQEFTLKIYKGLSENYFIVDILTLQDTDFMRMNIKIHRLQIINLKQENFIIQNQFYRYSN